MQKRDRNDTNNWYPTEVSHKVNEKDMLFANKFSRDFKMLKK